MLEEQQQDTTIETSSIKTWKYTVNQTAKGCRIIVHGDSITEVVEDYMNLHAALQFKGYKIAPDDDIAELKKRLKE